LALKELQGKVRNLVLRPPLLYGPRDLELLPMLRAIKLGFVPLYRKGNNQFSICYISDVVRAIGDLAESSPPSDEILCIDDGEIYTWKSFAQAVGSELKKTPLLLPIPAPIYYGAAMLSGFWAKLRKKPVVFTTDKIQEMNQKNWVCGHKKLKDLTGWQPSIKVHDGFKKTLQYYQTVGLL